ncbi:MAG: purine/pyrimidine phosphoribosyl transferase signature-containing protein [Gammaproteobacteria bacterium]|nr:purine/pyrimidine phosphoribosyl transferase signature-containing protein [Gammaproteobacteria bacterium]
MIRAVVFASCYVYSPAGSGATSERSRLLRALLKAGDAHFIIKYAVRVRQQLADNSLLSGFLCPSSVLVPIPGSAPRCAGFVSVPEYLATALVEEGVGRSIWRGLHRIRAVRKSGTAARGSRPTVGDHYDSFGLEDCTALPFPQQIVLIDDVVTKGRTLLAAAARVQEALPGAQVRAFALLRTMGLVRGVNRLLDPCIGEIRWESGDAYRNP